MKLFNGKYELITGKNQYTLREKIITMGKDKVQRVRYEDRYHATLRGVAFRLLDLETRSVINSQDWDSLQALGQALLEMETTICEEIKKAVN